MHAATRPNIVITFIGLLCLALAPLMLSACGSDYRPRNVIGLRGLDGGYEEEPGPGKLIKVSYTGPSSATVYMAANAVLYRSAEITQREGKAYFALYNDLPSAMKDRRSEKTVFSTIGGRAFSSAYIIPFAENAPGLLSAAEVIARLQTKVKGKPQ
ncbi:hypothetical protein HF313_24310 [Massilia atriviolacea]|uniref:Uncharacterized protein n=1 Tax=Massilia atriviolacea TaxID=2495579 RepID=A0A430HK14_9BURK|nr:hypothetical protein [Massilia atriviolacea]RSZ57864.1 hypothetical protein EJB06_16175 [Massilia atriviolacea]